MQYLLYYGNKMHLSKIPNNKKSEKTKFTYLIRKSYREAGKVKSKTILNISHLPIEVINAIGFALKNKEDISKYLNPEVSSQVYKSCGAVQLVLEVLKKFGVPKALGTKLEGKIALMQIISRVINQGSCLSTIRHTSQQALCEVLNIHEKISEDTLYNNLAWLAEKQSKIEVNLFKHRYNQQKPALFLYDVTSSYFEGEHNALASWGYNRDKKNGKKQLVAGLLCDQEGYPLSIELFKGNTLDYQTFSSQIKKTAEKFKCEFVTFVGDRGMIKSKQIEEITENDFYYITAITKPQIQSLLKSNIIEMGLFDVELKEVEYEKTRYLLRCNPQRKAEILRNRTQKINKIESILTEKNIYLEQHSRAFVDTAKKHIEEKIKKYKLENCLSLVISKENGRQLLLQTDSAALAELAKLDGCYIIKSNLPASVDKETIHSRYKDLAKVETAFKNMKTEVLELRPWYVQTEASTRGHAFVVMMAYLVIRYLRNSWQKFNIPVAEAIGCFKNLSIIEKTFQKGEKAYLIPAPNPQMKELLDAAEVKLPCKIPYMKPNVVSKILK